MIHVLDLGLFNYLNSWAGISRQLDGVIVFFADYLAYILAAAFLAGIFFTARFGREKKIRIFWVAAVSVVVSRFGITELIRFFYHRPRPFMVYHVYQLIAEHEWSFPSGHAALFFALAGVIYLYDRKWGLVFFAASIAMGIARVIAGVHYPSDILGGMVIGAVVACTVFYFAERVGIRISKI